MMAQNILLIDAGNSTLKYRAIQDGRSAPINEGRIDNRDVSAERLVKDWSAMAVSDAAGPWRLSWLSVGPLHVHQSVESAFESVFGQPASAPWRPTRTLHLQGHAIKTFINRYDNPGQLGADRWVSGVGLAVQSLIAPGEVHLIVSAGTATTVDVLRADSKSAETVEFLGGWIIPGVGLMNDALRRGTRDLDYTVSLADAPVVEIPKDSQAAITNGIGLSQSGFLPLLVERYGASSVWLHGGFARYWHQAVMASDSRRVLAGKIQEAPQLVFLGLMALADHQPNLNN
jgi:pantothenate kinase type III